MNTARHLCIYAQIVIGISLMTMGSGCGNESSATAALRPLFVSDCPAIERSKSIQPEQVLLDWNGGISAIYPDVEFEGLNLDLFEVADGGTLADDANQFQEDVRARVAGIYCDHPTLSVRVINADADQIIEPANVVQLTQGIPPKGGADVGEGEYDPCNRQHDNAALLFGDRLLSLGNGYAYDEWVNVFANVCAHEIGHALGYAHVERSDRTDQNSVYVELMLSGHTMAELRRAQRHLAPHSSCPDQGDTYTTESSEVVRP